MGTEVNNNIKNQELTGAIGLLRAIGHPFRLKVLGFIAKNPGVIVNKIYKALQAEQSLTSQQLRILRNSKLVTAKRSGRFIAYSLNHARLARIMRMLNKFEEA